MHFLDRLRIILLLMILSTTLGTSGHAPAMMSSHILTSDRLQCDYLIITTESLAQYLEPLAKWKSQRGLYTSIETVEDISETYEGTDLAEQVRNCIIDYHNEYNTTWVVLAGGSNCVPTRSVQAGSRIVSCDYYYANLDDNWVLESDGTATIVDLTNWEADVFVGRLPASTTSQMESLVSRLIEYESNPPVGPWMQTAVFAGTYTNFDMDSNGNNILDEEDYLGFDTNRNHHWIIDNILTSDWTSTVLGESEGLVPSRYPYDIPLNQSTFTESINDGASIMMADAHGSPTGMYRTIFTTDVDGDLLFDYGTDTTASEVFLSVNSEFDTNGKNCFAFLAACSTGSFAESGSCLTEYLTRTCSIGCIGSSQSSGYDPSWYDGEHLGWVTQGLSERVWEQLIMEENNHPGMALSLAKSDYAVDYLAINGAPDNGRTLSQYNLMGDPEVPIWIKIPESITSEIICDNSSRILSVKSFVNTQELSEAIVTVIGSSFYYRCVTDGNGEVEIHIPDFAEDEELNVTVTKKHHLPFQETVGVSASSSNSPLWSYAAPIVIITSIIIVAVVVVVKFKRT